MLEQSIYIYMIKTILHSIEFIDQLISNRFTKKLNAKGKWLINGGPKPRITNHIAWNTPDNILDVNVNTKKRVP